MPFDPTAPIDLDAIGKRNAETVVAYMKMTLLRTPETMPTPEEANTFMKNVLEGLGDNSMLTAEVKRLRGQRQKTRDIHSPANSSDPAAPGAVCTGCSVYGARVAWPCPTWKATEDPNPMSAFGMPL